MQLAFFETSVKKNSFHKISRELSGNDYLKPDEFGNYLRMWAKANNNKSVKTLALFSGAGGLDIGFSDAGFEVVEAVEIESKFVETLKYNKKKGKYLQHTNIVCQDIKEYVPNFDFPIDFIIGGPPCQSFSAAGRRAAGVAGTKDERGGLFEEYVRILNQLKPKGFLFENVYGLLGAEKGEAITKISEAFRNVGYNISYRVLDASDYGVPQHRERLIIVGSLNNKFKFPKPTNGPDSNGVPYLKAYQAIEGVENTNERTPSINGRFGHLLKDVPPGLNYSFFTEKMGHPEPIFAWRSKFSDFLYKADPNTPIRTLKASGGQYTGPFHWENRHFTIQELKRLQTFPDDYHITGNRAIASKQIGNSVPPQFARILALGVLEQFFEVKLPFELFTLTEDETLSFRKMKAQKTSIYIKKAKDVIHKDYGKNDQKIQAEAYRAGISKNFKYTKSKDKGEYYIQFEPSSSNWSIYISKHPIDVSIFQSVYNISLRKSTKEPLFGNVQKVFLYSDTYELNAYTTLWKAFESELAINKFKADLVQLNGYYQYPTKIIYEFKAIQAVNENIDLWNVIENLFHDLTIGQIFPIDKLANNYDLDPSSLVKCFKSLRSLGYEIRNHNTNPEIEVDNYLIPYKFPSLSSLSVQLKRSL